MREFNGWPLCPKAEAMACHLMPEFQEGLNSSDDASNPYDFWEEKLKHTAWCYGNQRKNNS